MIKPAALSSEDAAAYVSVSVPTLLRMVNNEGFPRPRQIGKKRVAYLTKEIDKWLESRPVSSQLPPPGCHYGRAGKPEASSSM